MHTYIQTQEGVKISIEVILMYLWHIIVLVAISVSVDFPL